MNDPIKAKIILQENYYVPFSKQIVPSGTMIEGYYDGMSVVFYKDNVCYQWFLGVTKHTVVY